MVPEFRNEWDKQFLTGKLKAVKLYDVVNVMCQYTFAKVHRMYKIVKLL